MESRLTIDTSAFDRSLDDAEARVKAFEDDGHKVKITAVFDTSSLSRARQQFAALDNQISKDAMARLRSNPQGSVLGALNALFSPHPVTGAPSATQAAQQGLLGKIVQAPGGNGAPGQGGAVQEVLGGGGGQGNANQRVSTVGLPQDNAVTTTDRVSTVGLPSDNAITTEDRVNVTGLPTSGGTVTTQDKVEPELDETSLKAKASQAGKDAADEVDDSMAKESKSKGSGWFSGFLSGIPAMVSGLFSSGGAGDKASSDAGKKAADSAAKSAKTEAAKQSPSILAALFGGGESSGHGSDQAAIDKGLLGGIGPGILGTSFKASSIAGLIGAGVGGLPALTAGVLPLATGAAGLGVAALGAKTLIGSANQSGAAPTQGPLYAQAQAAGAALTTMVQTAAKSLTGPLTSLFNQIPTLAKQVTPALSQVFAGSVALIQPAVNGIVSAVKAIGPGLSAAFQATGPLLQPLITGLGSLVSGLLPGLVSLLHAAAPAVSVVAGFFGSLGSNLGTMFSQFSTVIGPSSTILKALLDVVTGLLPVIGGLAQAMAGALGPAFTAFAGTIQALEPFLVGIGKIFAQFAGAVLQDLSGGLQLVANVLKAVAPAFNVLATALGSVFSTLESKGGFAQLGNILEGVATPLGNLIKSLVSGLAPAIPPILTLFSDLVNVVSSVGVKVLTALIPPITNLATIALGAILKVLPQVIPLVTQFITVFTADAGTLISQVGVSLLNLATVVLVKLLQAAQPLIPVFLSLLNAFTPLLNVLTPVVAATVTAIAGALAAVVNAIPPGVLTAAAVAVGTIIGAMKLWDLAIAGVAAAAGVLEAIMGSSLVGAIAEAIGTIAAFAAAAEGASLAETAMVGASLALEAVNPLVWVGLAVAPLLALSAALVLVSAQSQTMVGEFASQQQALGYNISGYQKLAATISTASDGYAKFASSSTDAVRGGAAGAAALSQQLSTQSQQVSAAAVAMGQRLNALSGTFGVSSTQIEKWASAAGISATKFSGAGENVGLLTSQIAGFVNKNAAAITATSSLSTNIAIFGDDVLSANTQLDAFNSIWNILVGGLLTKQMAITQAQSSFDNLKDSITQTGASSDQSQQAFQAYIQQVGSAASALEKANAPVSTINSYLQTQIDHLTSLGPLNKGQQADVDALKSAMDAYANSTHGLTDAQQTFISQLEGHLIADLKSMGTDTPVVNTAIGNLANSIAQTGDNSASTAKDRATLIADLKQAGVTAQEATSLVNGLSTSLKDIPKSVTSTVTITEAIATAAGSTPANTGIITKAALEAKASGGLVSGPGGPTDDAIPAWLSNGEYVLSAGAVSRYGTGFLDQLNAQEYASGGMVSGYGASISRGYAYAGSRGAQGGGTPGRGTTVDDLGDLLRELNGHMQRQVDATRAVPAGVGARVGGALNDAAHDGSFRGRYPRGGSLWAQTAW